MTTNNDFLEMAFFSLGDALNHRLIIVNTPMKECIRGH
jgi:hypothetical protein